MDIELEKNPLSNQKFNMLSADLKVYIYIYIFVGIYKEGRHLKYQL